MQMKLTQKKAQKIVRYNQQLVKQNCLLMKIIALNKKEEQEQLNDVAVVTTDGFEPRENPHSYK